MYLWLLANSQCSSRIKPNCWWIKSCNSWYGWYPIILQDFTHPRWCRISVRFCFKSTVCLFIVKDSPEGGFSGNVVKQSSQRKKHWEQLFWNSGKTPNKMFRWGFGAPAQCQKNSIISEWKKHPNQFLFKKKTKIPHLQKFFVIFFEKKVEFLAILLVTRDLFGTFKWPFQRPFRDLANPELAPRAPCALGRPRGEEDGAATWQGKVW